MVDRATRIRIFLGLLGLSLVLLSGGAISSCTVDPTGLQPDGQGGETGECSAPSDCPGLDQECEFRHCDPASHTCSMANGETGKECDYDGANVCDGAGECVESG